MNYRQTPKLKKILLSLPLIHYKPDAIGTRRSVEHRTHALMALSKLTE